MGGSLFQRLEAAHRASFDAVELREIDLLTSPRSPEQVRQLTAGLGLRVDAYQPLVVPTAADAAHLVRRGTHQLDVAARLGAGTLVVHVVHVDEGDDEPDAARGSTFSRR